MADDRLEPREATWRGLLPWTELFRGFQVALDFNKLILAAAGILVMALGWWLLAVLFAAPFKGTPPDWKAADYNNKFKDVQNEDQRKASAWRLFREERAEWNLMYESAGIGGGDQRGHVEDLSNNFKQFEDLRAVFRERALQANKPYQEQIDKAATPEDRKKLEAQ